MVVFSKFATTNESSTSKKRHQEEAPIPLEQLKKAPMDKGRFMTFKLKTSPGRSGSTTYDLAVPFFRNGTSEEFLQLVQYMDKVFKGSGIEKGEEMVNLAVQLFEGESKAAFMRAVQTTRLKKAEMAELEGEGEHFDPEITKEEFQLSIMRETANHVLPTRFLARQKRFLRRKMRKPKMMKVRTYVHRLQEINGYIKSLFGERGGLDKDELQEIIEFGLPAIWQKEMIRHGFDPCKEDVDLNQIIEFCERLEVTEEMFDEVRHTKKGPRANVSPSESESRMKGAKAYAKAFAKGMKNLKSHHGSAKGDFHCELHGPNTSHNTGECKVLLGQARRMKDMYKAQHPAAKKEFKKKNWQNNNNKNEIHAMVVDALRQISQEKARGKRKQNTDDEEEEVDIVDMENFNIDGLKIGKNADDLSISDIDKNKMNDE